MVQIGFFYDFDLTLSEEFQQFPLFREFFENLNRKYGIKNPEEYWSLCGRKDKSVGWMGQMLKDSNEIFGGLSNKRMQEKYGPQIKLAKGIPEFFSVIREDLKKKDFECEHHIISVGVDALIKGTSVFPEVDSIVSGEYEEDENGIIKIKNIVSEFRKVEHIKTICKGKGLHKDVAMNEYNINYKNAFVIGDGQSDVDMFRFILQRGGTAIAVFEPGSFEQYHNAVMLLGNSVNVIVPRDYSENSRIRKVINEIIQEKIEAIGKCDMDYELVHNYQLGYIESEAVKEVIKKHLEECEYCKKKLKKRFYFE
jgi:phosphoserine phosphatase